MAPLRVMPLVGLMASACLLPGVDVVASRGDGAGDAASNGIGGGGGVGARSFGGGPSNAGTNGSSAGDGGASDGGRVSVAGGPGAVGGGANGAGASGQAAAGAPNNDSGGGGGRGGSSGAGGKAGSGNAGTNTGGRAAGGTNGSGGKTGSGGSSTGGNSTGGSNSTGGNSTGGNSTAGSNSTAGGTSTGGTSTTAPALGAASSFAILGASTVTCTNLSSVTGDIGVSPGTAITGFNLGCVLLGVLHAGDALATQAHAALGIAYNDLRSVACQHNLTGQDLGGQTLLPGVYCFDTTVGLTGALTLNGAGDSNATWIFQVGTAITTATNSSVVMAGSGTPANVFWQIGSSATLALGTAFQGNILASASITLVSGSRLVGRALALNAAVTSDHNTVSLP